MNTLIEGSFDVALLPISVKELMANSTKCLNCGVYLKYLPNKEKRRNKGYCSLTCFYAKPPKMAYAEKVYGKPIRRVIIDLLNSSKNVDIAAQSLGVSKSEMYKQMKKERIRKVDRYE